MPSPFRKDKIENWVSEFCESDAARRFAGASQEAAHAFLSKFLLEACAQRDVEPELLQADDVKDGWKALGNVSVAPEAARDLPAMAAAMLSMLEVQGRLAGGRALGQYLNALPKPAPAKPTPLRRPGAKMSPNDPCLCGSGKKYKKCCQKNLPRNF